MNYRRWIILVLACSWAVALWAADRPQLAGIQLGSKPQDVIDALGEPTAYLMAQPPITEEGAAGVVNAATGDVAPPPNTLIFLWGDKEVELSTAGTVTSGAGGVPGVSTAAPQLPLWAYTVRVAKLSLDQQELIYRINDTYSVGVTITGQGAEARVTDVVACSFEPLILWPSDPKKTLTRSINFNYTASRSGKAAQRPLPAGTKKGIAIGSKLDAVLIAHKWPALFLPFSTKQLGHITIDLTTGNAIPDTKASTSIQDLADGGTSLSLSTPAGTKIPFPFAKNMVLLYPEDKLAITLVDYTVIRIQLGEGVIKPIAPHPSAAR